MCDASSLLTTGCVIVSPKWRTYRGGFKKKDFKSKKTKVFANKFHVLILQFFSLKGTTYIWTKISRILSFKSTFWWVKERNILIIPQNPYFQCFRHIFSMNLKKHFETTNDILHPTDTLFDMKKMKKKKQKYWFLSSAKLSS